MNVKELVGMTVFAIEGGRNVGAVDRLLFSPDEMRVTDLVISRGTAMLEEPEPQRILSTDRLKAIGRDAITIDSEDVLDVVPDGEVPADRVAFDEIEREKVLTESGDQIGDVSSISFSETDFRLESIEVSRGFLSGNVLIPMSQVISVGEDVIVVRDAALDARDTDEDREEHRLFREIDETGPIDDADGRGTVAS